MQHRFLKSLFSIDWRLSWRLTDPRLLDPLVSPATVFLASIEKVKTGEALW
jgi:hypothetical protein